MKANIPPFTIGDKVVYITGKMMPKNSKHTISHVKQHICGCWIVGINNIPITSNKSTAGLVRCDLCLSLYSDSHYEVSGAWSAKSFRKVSEQPMKKLTFAEIEKVEKEEVLTLN